MSHDLYIFVTDGSFHNLWQVLQDQSPLVLGMLERELLDIMADIPAHVDEDRRLGVVDQLLRWEEVEPAGAYRGVTGHAIVEDCRLIGMLAVVVVERRSWLPETGLERPVEGVDSVPVARRLEVCRELLTYGVDRIVAIAERSATTS